MSSLYTLNNQGPFFHCSLGSHTTICGASTTSTTPTTCSTLHKKYKCSLLIATGLGTSGKGWDFWGVHPYGVLLGDIPCPETRRKVRAIDSDRKNGRDNEEDYEDVFWQPTLISCICYGGGVFMYTLPKKQSQQVGEFFHGTGRLLFLESKYWRLKRQRSLYDTDQTMQYYTCVLFDPLQMGTI